MGRMRFAVRDDDTCFFTTPEDLEQVWGPLFGYVPISLAVTPFAVRPHQLGDPLRFQQTGRPMALGANADLVSWLRGRIGAGHVSVMCHGSTHEYRRRRTSLDEEYAWKPGHRLFAETATAKAHLSRVLGCPIRTFVPPGNCISKSGLEAVRPHFNQILTTLPLRRLQDFRLHPEYFLAYLRRLYYHLRYRTANPRGETIAGVRLFPSTSVTVLASWAHVKSAFEAALRQNADFVAAVHYWEMNSYVRDLLMRLIDLANKSGATFHHCDSLFDHSTQPDLAPGCGRGFPENTHATPRLDYSKPA